MNRCTEEIEAGAKKTFIHKFTVFINLYFTQSGITEHD